MQENYWQFILALQHNARLLFNNQLQHYNVHHDWCRETNNVFLVRDLETNELVYDSIVHLVVDLYEQGVQHCQLIPFDHLFADLPSSFKQFNFQTYNYPLAIFSSKHQSFALVNITAEKVKPFSTSSDPREFSGFPSTQASCGYLLFTLIKLDQKQQNILNQFNQPVDWQKYYQKLSLDILNHPFKLSKDLSLTLTNNLIIHDEAIDYPFLNEASPELNLAFSLTNKLESLEDLIEMELSMSMQNRSPNSSYIDENYSQIRDFQDRLRDAFIELVAHTANDYQNAYIDQNFKPISIHDLGVEKNTNELNEHESQPNLIEEKSTSIIASTLYLILFVFIVIGLLYGVYWLVFHYQFAKFTVMAIVITIFLAIWSKK